MHGDVWRDYVAIITKLIRKQTRLDSTEYKSEKINGCGKDNWGSEKIADNQDVALNYKSKHVNKPDDYPS